VETIALIGFSILAVSGVLCVVRLARGPSLPDRVLALDSLLIVGVVGVAIESARTRSGIYLDVLVVVALVAFVGTTSVARFIERRGAR
jgi:multicomponent Na+:H+ antiporter subunit F